jgi:hypothetical protein
MGSAVRTAADEWSQITAACPENDLGRIGPLTLIPKGSSRAPLFAGLCAKSETTRANLARAPASEAPPLCHGRLRQSPCRDPFRLDLNIVGSYSLHASRALLFDPDFENRPKILGE